MIKQTIKRIGKHHDNYCEDAVGHYTVGDSLTLLSVSDGCSMGNQSHFAAELIQKILKGIAGEEHSREFSEGRRLSPNQIIDRVTEQLFTRLQRVYQLTGSDKYDYLSTVVLACVDVRTQAYSYLVVGDGVVAIDDDITIIDQNNQPDYIGYHLTKKATDWLQTLARRKDGKLERSLAIATDGVLTLSDNYDHPLNDTDLEKAITRLLCDFNGRTEKELQNKLDHLYQKRRVSTTDDVAIARLRL